MKAKNLDTGNIANVGPDFLRQQSKPFIGSTGKLYPDGVWVAYNAPPLSAEASKVIKDAAATAPKEPAPVVSRTAPGLSTTPKAEELADKIES